MYNYFAGAKNINISFEAKIRSKNSFDFEIKWNIILETFDIDNFSIIIWTPYNNRKVVNIKRL